MLLSFLNIVKCILETGVSEVSGGGLNGTYSTIQFHLHWGDTEHHPGSEHTVDGHRYPMEVQHYLSTLSATSSLSNLSSSCDIAFCFPSLVDAHSQSQERCGEAYRGLRGNRCSGVFHKCMSVS